MKYILSRLLIMAAFTVLFAELAYYERGYFSIGIEWAIIPAILIIKEGICSE